MGKDLYDYLDQHIDLGNREVFRRKMESEESRRNLWNQAREMGFYHSSFEAFSAAAGHPVRKQTPEKTAGTHAPASAPQQTPDQTSEGEALFVQTINPYSPSDQAIRESWVRSRHKKTPRRLAGVVGSHTPASAPADATNVAPNRRPRLEGEEFVDGQFKPSYRLADGTLTTSIAEADRSERETRENRRLHAFEQRMIKAGRNPEDPYDRAIQEALESGDSRAAGSALFADADRKADAYNSRMAEISARLNAVNATSQSEINKAIQHAVAVESSRLAAEAGERTRIAREHGAGALQGQGLRKDPYDPEKMVRDAWAGLSSAARTKLVKEYQAIFEQNPDLIPDGKTPRSAAVSAIRQTLLSNLVARDAERRAPKSNAEFVARKILNDNILSLPYQLAGQSKSQRRAEFSAMNAYESEHPYWGITGSVIGMAVDPITWISGGVGKGASKIATGAVMRPIAATTRGNATRIVERALLSGALKGWRPAVVRGAGAVAGGSANFGTFEFLKDIQQQVFLGGTVDEYGNVIDGFDIGSSFDRARHGLAMGGATGVLGQAVGSLSKSAGRIANRVARGAAKLGTWSAGVGAEAGLFTLPELIEGKDDLAGAYRRNLAMVLGFKVQGALQQGASTVRKIREAHQRTGISLPDAVRLVRNENKIGSEFLTEHDRETLRRAGCGDLTDILFPEHGKTSRGQGRPSDGSKWWEKAREVSVAHAQQGEGSTSKLKDVTDGYELLQRALENKSVPQELKAKLIHIVTGGYVGTSPIHNVRTARRGGKIIVEALDRNGEVISSRNFKSERAAKAAKASLEQDVENGEHFTLVTEGANARLVRQTELALHEYARQNGISYDEAVRLYNDAARTVKDHDLDATAPEQTPTDPVEQAKALLRTICGMADAYHDNTRHMSPEAVAASMSAKYGVDMIKIINKPRASRNAEEKRLFSEYLDTLRRVARSKTRPRETADGASLGDYSSAVPSDRSRGAMWLSRLGLDPDRLGNFPERIGERLRNFCSTLTGSESARELKKTRKIYDKARRRLADAITVHADDLESSLGELLDKLDTLPASRREQLLDFLRTKAEFEAVRDRYLTDRQQRESALIRRIRERAYHANPGNIVTVRLKDGRTLYKIAHAADYFIAIDENGRPEMIPHDRIESKTHISVEDAIEAARARLDAEDADPLTSEQTPDNPEPPTPTPETPKSQAPEAPTSESTPTLETLSSDTSEARVTPEVPAETPAFREGPVEIALEDGKTIKGHIYDREPDGTYRIATADGRILTLTESEAKTLIKSYKPKQTPEQTPDNPEQTPEPTPTPETLSSDASAARVTPEAPEVSQAPKETQADPQAHPDVKPVGKGKFGDIYAAFRGKAKAAWQYLSALKSGQARGVFYRPEIGEIDLVWGDAPTPYSGKGLAHIDRKHVKTLGDFTSMDEAIEVIDDVVRNGEIKEEKANSIAIEKDRYRVIVARDEAGNWVLTAFDNTTSAKEKKKRKDAATRGTAGQPNAEARAVASDLSSGKVNTSLSDKQPQSQKSSDFHGIPLDEKGKPDYTGVPVEKTVAVMDSEDLGLRDAENTLKGAVKRRDAARRKLDGILVDMTDPARGKAARARAKTELDRCEKEVAYWQAVHDVYAARQAEEKRKADEAEAARKAEEREWKETKSRMDSRLRKVAEEVRDVPEAVEILNNSNPQTIEEVAALVLSGHKVLLGDGPNAERGARRFAGMGTTESKKLIGLFAKADKGGKSLEKLSETVMMETCAEYGIPYDQAEALDALMTVLNSVETRGDIHSFIVNARIERARKIADGIRVQWAEMEAEAIWEAYRMTPEEFRAYEEHRMEIARQALENFDEYEYNSYIADQLAERAEQEAAEAAKQNEHGLETDSGPEPARESPADGRSSEILSRQEPDLAPRSRTDEDRSQLPQGNGDQSRDPQRPLGEAERVAGAGDRIGNTGDAGRNGERAGDLAQAEEVGCELSEEVNEFGRPFVKSSDGTTTFGHIDPESGLAALPIKLSLGENYKDANGDDHGYGYLHIDAGHRKEILQNGFASVEDFVEAVAKNYTEIKEGAKIGENQTYLLEVSDEHNNTLFIQLSRDGKYWNVNSAGIFKKKYSRRKPKVYSKPAVGSGKDTDTTEVNSGQSKGATAPAGNSSETSDGKDNTLLSGKQGNGAENSENGELMDKAIGLRDSMNEALYWINDRYGTDYSGIDSLIRWAVSKGGIKALDRIADNYLSPSDAAKFKRELREYNSINKKISESSRGRLSIPTSPDSPLNTQRQINVTRNNSMSPASIERTAASLGLKVCYYQGGSYENGYYHDGVLHINTSRVHNGSNGNMFVLGHEMTHHLKTRLENPVLWKKLVEAARRMLIDSYGRAGYEARLQRTEMAYAEMEAARRGISIEEALHHVDRRYIEEELTADAVGDMLANPRMARRLFERLENPSAAAAVWRTIRDFFRRTTAALGLGSPYQTRRMQATVDALAEVYTEALGHLRSQKTPDREALFAKAPSFSAGDRNTATKKSLDTTRAADRDARYLKALRDGDMATARRLVEQAAAEAGYSPDSDYQGTSAFNGPAPSNAYARSKDERRADWETDDYEGDHTLGDWLDFMRTPDDQLDFLLNNPNGMRSASATARESISALRRAISEGNRRIKVYRSVPADIKENSLRDGDWVTPSRTYAKENADVHGWGENYRIIEQEVDFDDLWWDSNDINEWGYDSSSYMAYANTPNNRKLLETVTRDDAGEIIPLSRRFDRAHSDPRYSFATGPDDFDRTRDLAARHKGLVMPGLAEMEVKVVDVPRHNLNDSGLLRDQIDTWADRNPQFFKTHSLIDSHGVEIPYKISKKALLKYKNDTAVSKSDSRDAHFSVLQSLPKVLDNSIEVEIHPDFTKAKGINGVLSRSSENNINPTSLMHRFFGAVEYEGKLYRVKTTIKEFRDKNTQAKPHTFEVIKIELLESPSHNAKSTVKPLMTLEQSENGNTMLTSIPVVKLLKRVTKSYDPSVEVLKEDTNYVKSDSEATLGDLQSEAGSTKFSIRTDSEPRQPGAVTDSQIEALNRKLGASTDAPAAPADKARVYEAAKRMLETAGIEVTEVSDAEARAAADLAGAAYHIKTNRNGGALNYVVFRDQDMKIAGHTRFMRDHRGRIYGWVKDGKVFLNRDAMNPETPLHEYTHLWDEMVRKENPGLWERGKTLMKKLPLWEEVTNDPAYAAIRGDENEIAGEVHSRLTGRDGARILSSLISDAKKRGVMETARAVTLVDHLKRWLGDMFRGLKKTLSKWSKQDLKDLTIEGFVNMTLRDLTEGVNPKSGAKDLVAIHNISEENLRKALDLGGFPMPSIAITKAGIGHTGFGGISLVFGNESINPADRHNKVYSGDAWTPTFPETGYKLNSSKTREIYDRANKAGRLPLFRAVDFHPDNYERRIDSRKDDSLVDAFKDDYGAKQLFLSEKGNAVKEYEKRDVEKYSADDISLYEKVLEIIGEERLRDDDSDSLRSDLKRLIGKHSGKDMDTMKPFVANALVSNTRRKALDYADNGNIKTETDLEATRAKIDERIDPREFQAWLEQMFSGVVEKAGIRNERDMFTPSGESRAWEALYDAVTLDNVVKAMRRQADKGGTGFLGGSIFGASHRELKNMNDIRREAAERIRSVYDEEIETEKKRLEERLNKITLPSVEGSFSASMDFVDNVRAAVVKSHTPEGIYRYLSDIYPDMTMDVAKDISDIVGEIQKMSTRYLEAKPQRAVKFGEVRLAVVPAGTPDEIVKTLEDYGIAVRTYERGNEHERNAIISRETSERDLRFHAAMSREETDFDAIRERASDPTNPTTDFVEQRERSSRNSGPRFSFATGPDDFDRTRDLAVRHKGLVMPGLADKDVKVVDVPLHDFKGPRPIAQAKSWANEHLVGMHWLTDNNGLRIEYLISNKTIGKYLSRSAIDKSANLGVHLATLRKLPEIISESLEVEIHPDYNKNAEGSRTTVAINPDVLVHRFYGLTKAEEQLYRVKTTIKEYRARTQPAVPHSFEVTEIELLPEDSSSIKVEPTDHPIYVGVPHRTAKLLKGVTKSYDPSVEVLKENTNYVKSDSTADRKSSIMTGLDVDEMLSRGAVDLANDHRDDMELRRNAYKAIGGNLSKLRKAMAIQRDFDRASVKRVADLAEAMIDAGLLHGTTDYDVRRVLKSLRDANGKEDISKETDRLFDIMVRSFQRQSEADFNKLLKQKGSRLDTLGIDVRTNLEVTGQAMMSKLREAIHLPEIAYDLNGDLMPDTIQMHLDKAIEELREARKTGMGLEEATGRVLGLQYAQRYARSVDECRHNIAELKNDLAQLKETRKQGNGMSAKQYRDAVRAIRDRIREERLRSAKEIAGLSQDVATMMTQSATWADVLRLAEIERIDAIHHDANADLKGIEPRNTRDPRYDSWAKRWNRRIKSSLPAKWLSQSLATFEQCLKLFGRNSMDGSGYLYRRFMPQVTEAYENCWKARVEDTRMLDRIVADAFGDEKMTWSRFGDRLGLARRNRLKFLNGKNGGEGTETLDVTFWDGAGMHAYKIGVGEAMYIYMADKSSDGHMKLCAMGIDTETVDKLTAILPPEVIAVADALQNIFFVETRKRYNEVHKRIFGTEMEANENYVPMVINKNALDGKGDFTTDSPDNGLSSTTTGSVIRRKVNARPLDILNANIFNVVNKHIEDMEHWAAFSQLSKDLNSLINYKTFANKVAHITSSLGTGDELMRTFRECCQLATGNFRQADSALDRLTLKVGKNVSVAKVSLRLYTAFKQLSSAPAFWTDASASDIIYCGYNLRGSWEWAMKNLPMLNERWKGRSAGNEKIDHGPDAKSWLSRQMEAIAKAGMSPNAFVDALTCATGARAVYRTRLKRYRAMGYTEKDAARKALDDAEMSFNLSQQSSVGAYLSPMQMKRTVLSTALTLFRNSPMSYQRQSATALRNLSRHYRAGARDEMKRYRVKQLLREWGYDVEQQTGQYDGRTYGQSERLATSIADREWRLQPLKDLARLGIFGFVMPLTWNLFTEAPGIVAAIMAGDFDDAKDKSKDALVHALTGGWFEGLVAGNWFSDTIHSMISGDGAAADFVRHPLSQDLDRIKDKLDYDAVEALSDITGLLCQSYAGFNPAVLTDAVSAIIDATQGDMTTSKEIALCMARLAQVPQSQLNDIYFRELGCTGAEATKMTPAEISERYVRYKSLRTTLCLHDVASLAFPRMTEKRKQRFARQSDKALKEQRLRLWSDDLNEKFDLYSERAEEYRKADKEIRDNKNLLQTARLRRDLYRQPQWWQTTTFKAGETWLNHLWETYMTAKTPEEAARAVDRLRTAKPEIVEAVKQSTNQSRAARWTTKWKTDQKRRENRRKRTLPKTDAQRTDALRNRIADLAAQPFD